jgi:two-component system response regulator AtoC
MKKGAYDYISKPFKTDEVLLALKKAKERDQLKEENLMLQGRIKKLEQKYSFGSVVAGSEAMAGVFDLVDRVADFKTTVLITGESGTGKELIAKEIHSRGRRSSFNMVAINCAGIPETLLESELFGYKKGAFTDASRDKPGLFMQANKGTIFLDEIGEMPFSLQAKLLRILQEEEVTPLGGTTPEKTDARVIAATSKDLEYEVKEGRFREDLFYRINVMTIHLPPLRERRSDIPLLVSHFIDIFNAKLGKNVEGLSSEAMALLMGHSWSGNIRELENVIERAIILSKGKFITPAELPPSITAGGNMLSAIEPGDTLSIKKATRTLEQGLIEKALKLTGGNKSKAAQILEISRPILIAKIKEYDIT